MHYCGHFIIVNGSSGRQVRAITQHLKDTAREMGITPLSTEGQNTAKWMILDLGDVVIHIFDATTWNLSGPTQKRCPFLVWSALHSFPRSTHRQAQCSAEQLL